jgi:cyclopropane-fatty-acyl-phospholipid synthase
LLIDDELGSVRLGGESGPVAKVRIHDLKFWRLMATGGSVGAAETYMAGLWDSPDLVAVIQVLARNREALNRVDEGGARLSGWLLGLWHAFNRNSLQGSRRNIAAHYDLGNEFFSPPGWIAHDVFQRPVPGRNRGPWSRPSSTSSIGSADNST